MAASGRDLELKRRNELIHDIFESCLISNLEFMAYCVFVEFDFDFEFSQPQFAVPDFGFKPKMGDVPTYGYFSDISRLLCVELKVHGSFHSHIFVISDLRCRPFWICLVSPTFPGRWV
jgi:hypothetical protein